MAVALVLSAQEAARQRAPRTDGETKLLRGRNMLAFNIALDQGIFQLQGDQGLRGIFFGQRIGPGNVPGGSIRKPVVQNLPLAHEVAERGNHFFDWSDSIPSMQPVEIDVVRFQAAERAFQGTINILAAIASSVGIGRIGIERELGGQHDAITQATLANKFSQQLFALAAGVSISGVKEISSRLKIMIEQRARDGFFGSPTPFGAESHGTEAERANSEPRAP